VALPTGAADATMAAVEPLPLSSEDRAILELEGPEIAGHTCKVVVIGAGAPSVAELRELIGARIAAAPMLTMRLAGSEREPLWAPDPGFDLARHVGEREEAVAEQDLATAVAAIFEQRLPRDRPLWQIDVLRLPDGGAALVWRLHHALADGTAAMRFARELLWDRDGATAAGATPAPKRAALDHEADARRRAHLAGFIRREFAEARHRSPFDGVVGARRAVGFASTALAPLHDAAKSVAGATLNDAVVSTVGGALRHWLEHGHGALGSLRLRVPVSLHHEGDDAGNRDSFFTVPVPLDEADPVARLRAVNRETTARKREHDAEEMDSVLRGLSGSAPHLSHLVERLEAGPRSFAACVSNVPGPRTDIAIAGAPVRSLHSLAEIGRRHGLRIAVVSQAQSLNFGICADPAIVPDPESIAAAIGAEADALIAAARE
jgi:WS/DGAT/MGAT family acyltransferase